MRGLKAVPKGCVLRVREPVVGVILQLGELSSCVGPTYSEEVTLTALLVALVSADWMTWPSFKISTFKVP
jgi:hypothetical protein